MKSQTHDKFLLCSAYGVLIMIWGILIILLVGLKIPMIGIPLGLFITWIGFEITLWNGKKAISVQGKVPKSK